jgi:hypothetical protein
MHSKCKALSSNLSTTKKTVKDLEINQHSYGYLILDNGAKTYIGEKTAPSIKGVGKVGYPHAETKTISISIVCSKYIQNGTKILRQKLKHCNYSEKTLAYLGQRSIFLSRNPIAQEIIAIIRQTGLHLMENTLQIKGNIRRDNI